MSEYNKYVESVNKIFEIAAKMRVNYPDQDNISLLDAIEENKQIVINNAKLFNSTDKKQPPEQSTPPQQSPVVVTESLEG